jgi:tetratricopeptide (TPR) repeat protein
MNGIDLWQAKRPAEAINCYTRAIDADRGNLSARSLLAQSLAVLGRWDESLEVSTATVKDFPQDGAAHTDRAFALAGKERWDEALAEARQAVALAPDYAPAHSMLIGLLQHAGNPDQMVQGCREALRVSPLNPSLHRRLGMALAMEARSNNPGAGALADEAREQLSLAASLEPASADARDNPRK